LDDISSNNQQSYNAHHWDESRKRYEEDRANPRGYYYRQEQKAEYKEFTFNMFGGMALGPLWDLGEAGFELSEGDLLGAGIAIGGIFIPEAVEGLVKIGKNALSPTIDAGVRSLKEVIDALPTRATGLRSAYNALISGEPLDQIMKKALRGKARTLLKNRGVDIAGKQVHHIIPLEWAHLMGDNFNPNALNNLIPLERSVHREFSALWDDFRLRFPEPTKEQVLRYVESM
jgi:hypothetical protein